MSWIFVGSTPTPAVTHSRLTRCFLPDLETSIVPPRDSAKGRASIRLTGRAVAVMDWNVSHLSESSKK